MNAEAPAYHPDAISPDALEELLKALDDEIAHNKDTIKEVNQTLDERYTRLRELYNLRSDAAAQLANLRRSQ